MNKTITPETFQSYRPHAATRISYRHLPHWRQENTCAFVTFRLYDSLPESARQEYADEKQKWLSRHGIPSGLTESEILGNLGPLHRRRFQRFASSRYQKFLDRGLGSCALRDPEIRIIVEEAIWHGAGTKYLLGNAVIMPNHVHLLIQPNTGQDLKKILGNLRHYTARLINERLNQRGPFWMAEPFDHLVRSRFYFQKYRQYIQLNPARARLKPTEFTLITV